MPLGPAHTSATITLATGMAICAGWYAIRNVDAMPLLVVPGILAGLLLSPDLDVDNGSISNHHARKIGCLFGAVWYWYWRPYAWIHKHRGLSHAPVFGTLVRLIYCFWWVVFIPSAWQYINFVIWPVGALMVTDLLHIVMDKIKI